jgi:type IV secretory pathway VirD2 relaxase
MSDEDDFRLRTKARKNSNRGAEVNIPANYKGFHQGVRAALVRGKAVSGRRTLTVPSKPRTGRFNARGRGRAALERGIGPKKGWRVHKATGDRYRARRAIVKVRVVKLRNAKSSVSRGHLAYLQREGAGVERTEGLEGSAELTPTRGQLYGPDEGVEIDGRDFVARSQESFDGRGDPHQFRIMISPEDGAELARVNGDGTPNLKDTTRALMAQMEEDLGTRLDWVAVDHFDTAHPHTHIIARGVTHDGKGLNIAGEYISRGIRGRLEEELTRELGWKSELAIQQEMKRDVDAMRVTTTDRHIADGMDKLTNVIDLRAGSAASKFGQHSPLNRHILIGRMNHLEKMGLAQPTDKGRWQLDKDAFKTLGQIEQREQLNKDIHAAMERANIKRPVRLNDGRTDFEGNLSNRRAIGRVIAKALGRDEGMNPDAKGGGKVRFIIDGTDGYVSTVETGMDTRAGEAAKVGSIIEVSPPNLRTVDRNIQAIATGKDYHGKPHNGLVGYYAITTSGPEDWTDGSGSRGAAHIRAHRLRLAALAKAGVVEVVSKDKDGDPYEWRVPKDFEERAIALDMKQGRASGVKLLSVQDLEQQLASPGATWLDRAQVSWGRGDMGGISSKISPFAKELYTAFQQRREWLIKRGYAELHQDAQKASIIYKRGYMKALETEGFNAATEKLESMTSKAHIAAQSGRLIEGTVAQKYELPHGPHAMIETQRAFYLVPWESHHAQKWGKRIKGRVLSGGGIDWETGRTRGIGR